MDMYMSQGNIVKWHTNYTYIKFSSAFSLNYDFEQFLWIHNEKCSIFLSFKTRVKSITWNQYISVNVHVAQILIKQ